MHACIHNYTYVNIIAPAQGDLRLRGGSSDREGRVEIYVNGIWGLVCEDNWSTFNAVVVCRQLFGEPANSKTVSQRRIEIYCFKSTDARALYYGFTNSYGRFWLDDVQCVGTESRLIDCPARPLGQHNCRRNDQIGVSCPPVGKQTETISALVYYCLNCIELEPCSVQGDIRLQGGTATSGRVEICNNGTWGTVCDDLWSIPDARVACFQLGLPSSSKLDTCRKWPTTSQWW